MDALEEMARFCFGYRQWDAPYWFIGLEEGMSGTMEKRVKAWQKLGRDTGLSDCREFHREIGVDDHHKEGAEIQKTWRVLMLILLAYKGVEHGKEHLRRYQLTRLGWKEDETVLTELFGLPAKNVKEGAAQRKLHFSDAMIDEIHSQRIGTIRERLQQYSPSLVVMYGTSPKPKKEFARLAGRPMEGWDIFREGKSLITLIPHPTSHGRTNEQWIKHANGLREWRS